MLFAATRLVLLASLVSNFLVAACCGYVIGCCTVNRAGHGQSNTSTKTVQRQPLWSSYGIPWAQTSTATATSLVTKRGFWGFWGFSRSLELFLFGYAW